MLVTVCSIFRDSTPYLPRYFSQVAGLREHVNVRLILGEGDSKDHTPTMLPILVQKGDRIVTHDHGGPNYGSIDLPERWAQIAQVVRATKAQAWPPGDAFIWVEADLVWEPQAMVELLKADRCVAPMVYAQETMRHYDTFGFRALGQFFYGYAPYWPEGVERDGRFVKLDSCGSCFVVPADDFDVVESWDGIWPFTAGGRLWLDPTVEIRHP